MVEALQEGREHHKLSLGYDDRRMCAQVRELEEEVAALQAGRAHRAKLMALMEKKAIVGDLFNQLRLARAPETLSRS